jgi:hypothetical protein
MVTERNKDVECSLKRNWMKSTVGFNVPVEHLLNAFYSFQPSGFRRLLCFWTGTSTRENKHFKEVQRVRAKLQGQFPASAGSISDLLAACGVSRLRCASRHALKMLTRGGCLSSTGPAEWFAADSHITFLHNQSYWIVVYISLLYSQ